ncbi:hypothetical protein ACF0H5_007793 [Mactra antiquata]
MFSDGLPSGMVAPDSIRKENSELIKPMLGLSEDEGIEPVGYREPTFDDLFRERFIPLDCRKKVGNYVIGKTFGEGSFSKVRLAKHVSTGEKRAVKILPKKTVLNQCDVRRRFLREVRSLRQITHENVVQLFEVMETSRNYYIVLELLPGDNFKEYLRKRKSLPEDESRYYMNQISDAINYLHMNDIVHRDLKPENILLEKKQIKIIDFGLSTLTSAMETMTTQCGSPAYAAPEIFTKQPYTKRVDVWSIGVILYLSLTGSLPFNTHGRSSVHQYANVLQGYTLPPGIPLSEGCCDILAQMLKVNPDERISSSDLVHHAWLKNEPNLPGNR